jgi:hypothetical protein
MSDLCEENGLTSIAGPIARGRLRSAFALQRGIYHQVTVSQKCRKGPVISAT